MDPETTLAQIIAVETAVVLLAARIAGSSPGGLAIRDGLIADMDARADAFLSRLATADDAQSPRLLALSAAVSELCEQIKEAPVPND